MPGLYTRIKNWVKNETVASVDLNAEFNNVINNFTPDKLDDYSTNVATMQATTDPGEVGSESLATTTAGEIERLRFAHKEATGMEEWYESPPNSLVGLNASVSGFIDTPNDRIISGKTTLTQPTFLVPDGSSNGVTCEGSATPLVVFIDGVQRTLTTDITTSALSDPPVANNTALIDDILLVSGVLQWAQGEGSTVLNIDTIGSEWTSLIGSIIAFKVAASSDYYSIGFLQSSTVIKDIYHGFFFNQSDAPIKRIRQTDNQVLTLARINYVFLKYNAGTDTFSLDKTPNRPFNQVSTPTGAVTGDFWHDIANDTWKEFDGALWNSANAVPIGIAINDENGNTVGARTNDFFKTFSDLNTIRGFRKISNSIVETAYPDNEISIYGDVFNFTEDQLKWDVTTTDTYGEFAGPSLVGLYRDNTGVPFISDVFPYDRRHDLKGWYHPWRAARCFGMLRSTTGLTFDTGDVGKVFFETDQIRRNNKDIGGVSVPTTGTGPGTATQSAVMVDMALLNVTLKTNGNPVMCVLSPEGSIATEGFIGAFALGAVTTVTVTLALNIDGTDSQFAYLENSGSSSANMAIKIPSVTWIADVDPGEHTFKIRWSTSASTQAKAEGLQFYCYEIGQVGKTTYNQQQEF